RARTGAEDRSEHAQLKSRGLAHHFPAPWRIPYEVHLHFFHAMNVENLAARFIGNHRDNSATGCDQCHSNFNTKFFIAQGDDVAAIDQTQVDDVDRNFRVVAGTEHVPGGLTHEFLGDGAVRLEPFLGLDLQTERIDILRFDAIQIALHHDGDTATQLLGDHRCAALLDRD